MSSNVDEQKVVWFQLLLEFDEHITKCLAAPFSGDFHSVGGFISRPTRNWIVRFLSECSKRSVIVEYSDVIRVKTQVIDQGAEA
ncbi:hypothetical protein ABTM75_19185, partial [Acinetobacter baumannii]